MVRLGVAIPQADIGASPGVVGRFVREADRVGYQHVATYDHVLGANVAHRPDWQGPYTSAHTLHDTFVLFGYLAAITDTIELSTQVLILPQRQTALVAKQAASVDVLSHGMLRLGVGTGWNPVEYIGLGESFEDRGARSGEQAELLRRLWTEPHVTFSGSWHEMPDAGINPQPIQQPIPLWFGGSGDRVMRRIAEYGDGWITFYHEPNEAARADIERLGEHVELAGRSREEVGIDAWASMGESTPEQWRQELAAWTELGVSHITLNTAFHVGHHKRIHGTTDAEHPQAINAYIETVSDLL